VLIAKDYDINFQRILLGKKQPTPKTKIRISPIALIRDLELSPEDLKKRNENRKRPKKFHP
jgi:hypothetical protein